MPSTKTGSSLIFCSRVFSLASLWLLTSLDLTVRFSHHSLVFFKSFHFLDRFEPKKITSSLWRKCISSVTRSCANWTCFPRTLATVRQIGHLLSFLSLHLFSGLLFLLMIRLTLYCEFIAVKRTVLPKQSQRLSDHFVF